MYAKVDVELGAVYFNSQQWVVGRAADAKVANPFGGDDSSHAGYASMQIDNPFAALTVAPDNASL